MKVSEITIDDSAKYVPKYMTSPNKKYSKLSLTESWLGGNFCKENPRNNEEFRRTVEKMITVEEKTRERFPDRNNRDNHRNIDSWRAR